MLKLLNDIQFGGVNLRETLFFPTHTSASIALRPPILDLRTLIFGPSPDFGTLNLIRVCFFGC